MILLALESRLYANSSELVVFGQIWVAMSGGQVIALRINEPRFIAIDPVPPAILGSQMPVFFRSAHLKSSLPS